MYTSVYVIYSVLLYLYIIFYFYHIAMFPYMHIEYVSSIDFLCTLHTYPIHIIYIYYARIKTSLYINILYMVIYIYLYYICNTFMFMYLKFLL